MGDLIILLASISALCFTLGICGIIADYILPRSKSFARWVESLGETGEEMGSSNEREMLERIS